MWTSPSGNSFTTNILKRILCLDKFGNQMIIQKLK